MIFEQHLCVGDVCGLLYPMQTAFPSVYQLFAAATSGASSVMWSFILNTHSRPGVELWHTSAKGTM